MADTEKAPEGEAAPAPSGKKKMLPIILIVLGGLIFGGAAGAFMLGPTIAKKIAPGAEKADAPKAEASAAKEEGKGGKEGEAGGEAKVFLLDNMVLNPAGSSGQRFLLVSIALRLKDVTVENELKARDAEVRDALLHVLGTKHVEELSDIAQRDALKDELRKTVDAIVKPGAISGLYFPQFVIQ
jgi:flagellar basal body-associated protein FliL